MRSAPGNGFDQAKANLSLIACDYDGTIATDGVVSSTTLKALKKLKVSGRALVLVTGRELRQLLQIFPHVSLFGTIISENGAVIYDTARQSFKVLGSPPPPDFMRALRDRVGAAVDIGKVIVATSSEHAHAVSALVEEMRLPYRVILNKDSAMLLPASVNKGSGLTSILASSLKSEQIIGVGDGENDVDLFLACGYRVAVANAVQQLKKIADWVAPAPAGEGFELLADALLA